MILLTPFLTVLSIAQPGGALIHAALWPEPAGAADLALDLPPQIDQPIAMPGLPGFRLHPGARERLVRISKDSDFVCVHPARPTAFLRPARHGPFEFLLASEADLANLRTLHAHAWTRGTGPDAREITLVPAGAFCLDAGDATFDLSRSMPRRRGEAEPAPDQFEFAFNDVTVTLARRAAARDEILLCRAPPYARPADAATEAEFRAEPNCFLALPGEEEISSLPLTVCDADLAWLHDKPMAGNEQRVGRQRYRPIIARAHGHYVIMARHLEGMIFGQHGVLNEAGYLDNLGTGGRRHLPLPPGMRQEGERFFVDRATLADSPRLDGPHIVFYGGTLPNYAHWLIESMLPLHVMLPHVPPDARLLLPATLRAFRDNPTRICDHHDIMRAFGFAGLPSTEIAAPYCWVEDVYWMENASIQNMPAEHVRAVRAHVASLRPPQAQADIRVHIARRGSRRVVNAEPFQQFLRERGFRSFYMEDMTIDEQIDLFARAEWVIGAHGAEMGNLLFSRPGTKVLELAPDSDFKPFFSYLCNKLALAHGILPCPTHDGGFSGDMTVDIDKLTALFRMLRWRL